MSDEVRAPDDRPASFSDVFANREFRAVYAAGALSWFGDYLAKAAVTALVYQRTESVAVSAATFALTYVPWLLGGTLLSTLADRYPYRRVMVVCDLLRMVLIGLVALPREAPIRLVLLLLFLTALASPPGQAAKAALLPLILTRDRLVVGLALNTTTGQAAQVTGYLAGAAIAPFHPRLALAIDAATFGLSALLIRFGVRDHPAVSSAQPRRHLIRETGDGIKLVFGTPVLRAIAILVFASMLFAIVPEGLAAAWADEVSDSDAELGLSQGLIMAASPVGFIVGGLLISRLVRPGRRHALIRPLAILSPLVLVPALVEPSATQIALMSAASGFAVAGILPTANALFVQVLPHGYRARSFGVMQTGMQILQGAAVLCTGVLADAFPIHEVVGYWSLAGVLVMVLATLRWPGPQRFADAAAAVAPAPPPSAAAPPATAASPQPPSGAPPPTTAPTAAPDSGDASAGDVRDRATRRRISAGRLQR